MSKNKSPNLAFLFIKLLGHEANIDSKKMPRASNVNVKLQTRFM